MLRKWASALLAVVLALGVAVVAAPPASAANGVMEGITSADAFSRGLAIPQWPDDGGGWNGGSYRITTPGGTANGWALQASEMYTDGNGLWMVLVDHTSIDKGRANYIQGFGLRIYCAKTADGAGQGSTGNSWSTYSSVPVSDRWQGKASCPTERPYMVAGQLTYIARFGPDSVQESASMWWWPGDYYGEQNPYEDSFMQWCKEQPTVPECANAGVVGDGTQFSVACANPPSAEWLSFAWLPEWVGHYAKCLTVPLNGWDPDDAVSQAYEDGAIGTFLDVGGSMASDLRFVEGCGSLGSVTFPTGPVLSIDTCTGFWQQLGTIKSLLSLAMIVGATIAGMSAVIKALGPNYLGFDDSNT